MRFRQAGSHVFLQVVMFINVYITTANYRHHEEWWDSQLALEYESKVV